MGLIHIWYGFQKKHHLYHQSQIQAFRAQKSTTKSTTKPQKHHRLALVGRRSLGYMWVQRGSGGWGPGGLRWPARQNALNVSKTEHRKFGSVQDCPRLSKIFKNTPNTVNLALSKVSKVFFLIKISPHYPWPASRGACFPGGGWGSIGKRPKNLGHLGQSQIYGVWCNKRPWTRPSQILDKAKTLDNWRGSTWASIPWYLIKRYPSLRFHYLVRRRTPSGPQKGKSRYPERYRLPLHRVGRSAYTRRARRWPAGAGRPAV